MSTGVRKVLVSTRVWKVYTCEYMSVEGTCEYMSVEGTCEYTSVEGTCEYMSVEGTFPNSSIPLHNKRHGKQPYYCVELSRSHSKFQPEWVLLVHNQPPQCQPYINSIQ